MLNSDTKIETKIANNIIYYLVIFFIFLFWFFYSTYDNVSILILICFSMLSLIIYSLIKNIRKGMELETKFFHILLIFIPITFLLDIIYFYDSFTPPFFIPFYDLIGIKHQHNIILILLLFSLIFVKLIGVKIYFSISMKINADWKGDEIFEFFAQDITNKKIILLIILFPLGAFVEEFIYRCLFLSVLIYSLKWDLVFSIFFISCLFGIVHYSASKNLGHVLSTLISSIIYFYALINLGLLYPWIFHFLTNLLVVLFYVQNRKKKKI